MEDDAGKVVSEVGTEEVGKARAMGTTVVMT